MLFLQFLCESLGKAAKSASAQRLTAGQQRDKKALFFQSITLVKKEYKKLRTNVSFKRLRLAGLLGAERAITIILF